MGYSSWNFIDRRWGVTSGSAAFFVSRLTCSYGGSPTLMRGYSEFGTVSMVDVA